jgi:hypothetical protein
MVICVCLFVFINFHAFNHINITLEPSVISSSTAFDVYFETKTKKIENKLLISVNYRHTPNYKLLTTVRIRIFKFLSTHN